MKFRVLLPLIFTCFTTIPLCAHPIVAKKPNLNPRSAAEQRAVDVLQKWHAENARCNSIRGDFQRICYDDMFQVEKHGKGQFGYLGPRHGFWRIEPAMKKMNAESRKKNSHGKPYAYKVDDAGHWRWQKTRVLNINEKDKYYDGWIFTNKPRQKKLLGLYAFVFDMTADFPSPFLPGAPNQTRFNELLNRGWFKVIHESETNITITGKPPRNSQYAHYVDQFKLHLEKDPWRLSAVKYIHPGRNHSTVYLFSNIEMNPLEWDEPDLKGYENRLVSYEDPFQ